MAENRRCFAGDIQLQGGAVLLPERRRSLPSIFRRSFCAVLLPRSKRGFADVLPLAGRAVETAQKPPPQNRLKSRDNLRGAAGSKTVGHQARAGAVLSAFCRWRTAQLKRLKNPRLKTGSNPATTVAMPPAKKLPAKNPLITRAGQRGSA